MKSKIATSLTGQILSALVGLAVISACTLETGFSAPAPLSLAETQWQLKTLNNAGVTSDRPLTLNLDETRINGYAGCNRFFGGYVASADGVFSTSATGTTKMACTGERDQLERDYLQHLSQTRRYAVVHDQLHLLDDQRQILLVYQAVSTHKKQEQP